MAFDYELARAVARGRDRDTARFFAGRGAEIGKFDDALAELADRAERDAAAEFVIYQGAPGCGKTSLFNHLRSLPKYDDVLFVTIGLGDLADEDALRSLVWGRIESASSTRGAEIAGFAETSGRSQHRGRHVKAVVLHLDEAQVVDETARPGLLMLHTQGVGFPCAMVLTGLSHTKDRVSSIKGLSRLAGNSTWWMGKMAADEGVESTLMMFRRLHPTGTASERARAAELVATLAQGWPHHLCGAQVALCRELLRTSGLLREVDTDQVSRESEHNRHDYYLSRLARPPLSDDPSLAAAIIVKVHEQKPRNIVELQRLCRDELANAAWPEPPDPKSYANALVEKGAVTITLDGRCEIPIPSMSDWALSVM